MSIPDGFPSEIAQRLRAAAGTTPDPEPSTNTTPNALALLLGRQEARKAEIVKRFTGGAPHAEE